MIHKGKCLQQTWMDTKGEFMLESIIGFISGTVSGMGMGGGTLLIPALVLFMDIEQKTAQGINLLYFLPSSISALIIHIKNKHIKKDLLAALIFGGLIGASIGSFLAVRISNDFLRRIFAVFLTIMGVYEIFCKDKNQEDTKTGDTCKKGDSQRPMSL